MHKLQIPQTWPHEINYRSATFNQAGPSPSTTRNLLPDRRADEALTTTKSPIQSIYLRKPAPTDRPRKDIKETRSTDGGLKKKRNKVEFLRGFDEAPDRTGLPFLGGLGFSFQFLVSRGTVGHRQSAVL